MDIMEKPMMKQNVRLQIFESKSVVRKPNGDIASGKLIEEISGHNMNVNAGLNFMRNAISRSVTFMGYVAAGTDSTAAAAGQTALLAEIDRVAVTGYEDSATGEVVFTAIFEASDANGNLAEFGVFNDPTAGIMLARYVTTPFTKDTSFMLRVLWTVTFTDA